MILGAAAHFDGLGTGIWIRHEAWNHLGWQRPLEQTLDFLQELHFIDADQAEGLAFHAGTARAANAVHVVLSHMWSS